MSQEPEPRLEQDEDKRLEDLDPEDAEALGVRGGARRHGGRHGGLEP